MSYFSEIDAWLTEVLGSEPEDGETEEQWFERVKKQIKDKLLESYRNGQKAHGSKPEKSAEEKPRSHFGFLRKKPRRQ